MTKWLEWQEKIMIHTNYISWWQSQTSLQTTEHSPLPHMMWDSPDMACVLHPKMMLHPTRKSVHLDEIILLAYYGASNFVPAFATFITQFCKPHLTAQQIEDEAIDVHLPFHDIAVFHQIRFWNQDIGGNDTLDSIHAHPPVFNNESEVVKEAHFDTVLVQLKGSIRSDTSELPSVYC